MTNYIILDNELEIKEYDTITFFENSTAHVVAEKRPDGSYRVTKNRYSVNERCYDTKHKLIAYLEDIAGHYVNTEHVNDR